MKSICQIIVIASKESNSIVVKKHFFFLVYFFVRTGLYSENPAIRYVAETCELSERSFNLSLWYFFFFFVRSYGVTILLS